MASANINIDLLDSLHRAKSRLQQIDAIALTALNLTVHRGLERDQVDALFEAILTISDTEEVDKAMGDAKRYLQADIIN